MNRIAQQSRFSAPGNLLLAGEYVVLSEGGPGLALAIEPRISGWSEPASRWSVLALMGPQRIEWQPGEDSLPLAACIFQTAEAWLRAAGQPVSPPQRIVVDTGACFLPDGRKRGFGSSAAAAVVLAALLLDRKAIPAVPERLPPVLEVALMGHRLMQGGRGSGYDVFTSYYGGFGLFRGGKVPSWTALPQTDLPELRLYAGAVSVASGSSVAAFQEACAARPELLAPAVLAMRQAVEDYVSGSLDLADSLRAARHAGIALGDLIGVSARMQPDIDSSGCFSKALGAGNELGCLVGKPGGRGSEALHGKPDLLPVLPAAGLRSEPEGFKP